MMGFEILLKSMGVDAGQIQRTIIEVQQAANAGVLALRSIETTQKQILARLELIENGQAKGGENDNGNGNDCGSVGGNPASGNG